MADEMVFKRKVAAHLKELERVGPGTREAVVQLKRIALAGLEHPYNALVEMQRWILVHLRALYGRKVASGGATEHLPFATLVDRLIPEARQEKGIYYLDLQDLQAVIGQAREDHDSVTLGILAEAIKSCVHLYEWFHTSCLADGEIALLESYQEDIDEEWEEDLLEPEAAPIPLPEPEYVDSRAATIEAAMPMETAAIDLRDDVDTDLHMRIGPATRRQPTVIVKKGIGIALLLLLLLLAFLIGGAAGFFGDEYRHRDADNTEGLAVAGLADEALAAAEDEDGIDDEKYETVKRALGEAERYENRIGEERINVLPVPDSLADVRERLDPLRAIEPPVVEIAAPIVVDDDTAGAIAIFLTERALNALDLNKLAPVEETFKTMTAFIDRQFEVEDPAGTTERISALPEEKEWEPPFEEAYLALADALADLREQYQSELDRLLGEEREAMALRAEAERLHGRADESTRLTDVVEAVIAIDEFTTEHEEFDEEFDPDRQALADQAALLAAMAAEDELARELLRDGERAISLAEVVDALDRLIPFIADTERYDNYQEIVDRLMRMRTALELLGRAYAAAEGSDVPLIERMIVEVTDFGDANPDWYYDMEDARRRLLDRLSQLTDRSDIIEELKRRAREADEMHEVVDTSRDIDDFLDREPRYTDELQPYREMLDAKKLYLEAHDAWTISALDRWIPQVQLFVAQHPDQEHLLTPLPIELPTRRAALGTLAKRPSDVTETEILARIDEVTQFCIDYPVHEPEYTDILRFLERKLEDIEAERLRQRMPRAFTHPTVDALDGDMSDFMNRVPRYSSEFRTYRDDLARRKRALNLIDQGEGALARNDQPLIVATADLIEDFLLNGNPHPKQRPELLDLLDRLRGALGEEVEVIIDTPVDGSSVDGLVHDLSGRVNHPEATHVRVDINGRTQVLTVSNGRFEGKIVLTSGVNDITVEVANEGLMGSDTVRVTCHAETSELWVQLTWEQGGTTDLDLYVTDPTGTTVYFNVREANGCHLDVDTRQGYGPEHYTVTENRQRDGWYDIRVHYYAGIGPVRYTLSVLRRGEFVGEYSGEITQAEQSTSQPGNWNDASWRYIKGIQLTGNKHVRNDPNDRIGHPVEDEEDDDGIPDGEEEGIYPSEVPARFDWQSQRPFALPHPLDPFVSSRRVRLFGP